MTQEERIEKEFEAFNQKRMLNSEGYPPEEWFKAGWEAALRNQWISVDEDFPKEKKNVFGRFEDGNIIVCCLEDDEWWWQDGFVCGTNTEGELIYTSQFRVFGITHWMEIPK